MPVADGSQRARMRRNTVLRALGLEWCPGCEKAKPFSAFHQNTGKTSYCKSCANARTAAARKINRDRENSRHKRWRDENPEKARRHGRIAASCRRARIREAFVEDVDPLVVYQRDEGVCGLCGKSVEPGWFDVDHIKPLVAGGEHSYSNVRLAHVRCNRSRGRSLALAEKEMV